MPYTSWRVVSVLLIWTLAVLGIASLLLGCEKHEELPTVPAAPEDLSTWSVPELVQPPLPEMPCPQGVTGPQCPQPPKEKPSPAEQVLDYTPGTTFTLTVGVGAPLDLVLQQGEQVRNIIGGDRAPVEANQVTRWEIKEGGEGIGETFRQHIFLSATTPGLTTGLVVTTTARTYLLTAKSVGKSPIRTVRWRYPVDITAVKPVKEPGLLPDPTQQKYYHVGYTLTSQQKIPPDWLPRHVVDDGKKLYIVFPEITLFETAPMARKIGPNGPQLLNTRQFLNVLIVDELAGRVELRVGLGGTAEVVTITRGALRTMVCPGDEACPVWPHAAQLLAERSPPTQPPPTHAQPQTDKSPAPARRPVTRPTPAPPQGPPVPPVPPPHAEVKPPQPEGDQP